MVNQCSSQGERVRNYAVVASNSLCARTAVRRLRCPSRSLFLAHWCAALQLQHGINNESNQTLTFMFLHISSSHCNALTVSIINVRRSRTHSCARSQNCCVRGSMTSVRLSLTSTQRCHCFINSFSALVRRDKSQARRNKAKHIR